MGRPGIAHEREDARRFGAQPAQTHAFEGGGAFTAVRDLKDAGRGEWRREGRLRGGGEDEHRDGAAGAVEGGEGACVVGRGDMEDDVGVRRIAVVAMRTPAAGTEVEFDIAAQEVAAGIEDGAREIGAGSAAGDAWEDDAQGAAIFEAQGAARAGRPVRAESGFIGVLRQGSGGACH